MRKFTSAFVAAAVGGSFAAAASAAVQYTVVDLAATNGGTVGYYAYGENSLGTAVGQQQSPAAAELYNGPASAPTALGTLGGTTSVAYGVNTGGLTVGQSPLSSGTNEGFYYTAATGIQAMGSLVGAGGVSSARAVNDTGVVAGSSITSAGVTHATSYTVAGGFTDLGVLPGTGTTSNGYGINGNGVIVGASNISVAVGSTPAVQHAFIDTPNATGGYSAMTDLGVLPNFTSSTAFAINATNEVVGYSISGTVSAEPFYTSSTGALVDLGQFISTDTSTTPEAVNDAGAIVGFAAGGGGGATSAWLNTGSGYTDLNTVIGTGTGWALQRAYGINDAGDIVGYGTYSAEGTLVKSAFELVPVAVPEPTSVGLLAAGGVALAARRRSRRSARAV